MCKKMFCLMAFTLALGLTGIASAGITAPWTDGFNYALEQDLTGKGQWIASPGAVDSLVISDEEDTPLEATKPYAGSESARDNGDWIGNRVLTSSTLTSGQYTLMYDVFAIRELNEFRNIRRNCLVKFVDGDGNTSPLVSFKNDESAYPWGKILVGGNDNNSKGGTIFLNSNNPSFYKTSISVQIDLDVADPNIRVYAYHSGTLVGDSGWMDPNNNLGDLAQGLAGFDVRINTSSGQVSAPDASGYDNFEWVSGLSIRQGSPPDTAWAPHPHDASAIGVVNVTSLSWRPGASVAFAGPNGHDVYFGTNLADVNDANSNWAVGTTVYKGNTDLNTYPLGFEAKMGETYYWRIDEVNKPNGSSPWRGEIWAFGIQCPHLALSTDLNDDCLVDGKDYAELADEWLDVQMWPVQP